jgi:hypothetical protein
VETLSGAATLKRSTLPASQQLYRIWLIDLERCYEITIEKNLPFDVADELFLRELTRLFQKQSLPNPTRTSTITIPQPIGQSHDNHGICSDGIT